MYNNNLRPSIANASLPTSLPTATATAASLPLSFHCQGRTLFWCATQCAMRSPSGSASASGTGDRAEGEGRCANENENTAENECTKAVGECENARNRREKERKRECGNGECTRTLLPLLRLLVLLLHPQGAQWAGWDLKWRSHKVF